LYLYKRTICVHTVYYGYGIVQPEPAWKNGH